MDILQEETAVNFLNGNEFKAILPDLRKCWKESCLRSIHKSFQVTRV